MEGNKLNHLELSVFLREKLKASEITFAQYALLGVIASRNGINANYLVTQKMLAEDLNVDVSYIRKISKTLIDKNIIKVTKGPRSNYYSISPEYRSYRSDNNLNTAPTEAAYSASTEAVLHQKAIYINNKIINNKIPPIVPQCKNQIAREEDDDFLPNGFIVEKVSGSSFDADNLYYRSENDQCQKSEHEYRRHFKQFEEYSESFLNLLKEYPRPIYQSEKDFCWKIWCDWGYEKSSQQIIDNVILRKAKDSYWVEMISKNNPTRIKSLKNFILDKFWEVPLTENNNEDSNNGKNINAGKQHRSASSKLQEKLRAQLKRINAAQH